MKWRRRCHLPLYEFQHPSTGEIFEVLRPFSQSGEPFIAPDGIQCQRLLSLPQIRIGEDKPDRYERKEVDHRKRVKDRDRAQRNRRKLFGSDNVNVSKSDLAKRKHTFKKETIKTEKSSQDIDRKQFIQAAARNPIAVAAAKKVLKK
jgi:hypothetical protein